MVLSLYLLIKQNAQVTSSYEEAFTDSEAVILLGGFPRRPGMERVDLIHKNTSIFREIGPALDRHASKDVKVVVVATEENNTKRKIILLIQIPTSESFI